MIKKLSIVLLEAFEALFLYAHGWKREQGAWEPPIGYPFRRLLYTSRRHAVNAQRQAVYNPTHGGYRREPEATIGTELHGRTKPYGSGHAIDIDEIMRLANRHRRQGSIAIAIWWGVAVAVVLVLLGLGL